MGRGLRRRQKNATEAGAGRFEKRAPDARAAPPEAHESLISRKSVAVVPLTGLSFTGALATGMYGSANRETFPMKQPPARLADLLDAVRRFRDDRDWAQFHTPKNLAAAIAIEAAGSCHVEVTNLLIPGLNDSAEETRELVDFIASVDVRIPLHFSRYFPQHRMTLPATPLPTLTRAADIASETLYYVYLGNAGGSGKADTACPVCGNLLVRRGGYEASVLGIADGACARCGRKADFLWCR